MHKFYSVVKSAYFSKGFNISIVLMASLENEAFSLNIAKFVFQIDNNEESTVNPGTWVSQCEQTGAYAVNHNRLIVQFEKKKQACTVKPDQINEESTVNLNRIVSQSLQNVALTTNLHIFIF